MTYNDLTIHQRINLKGNDEAKGRFYGTIPDGHQRIKWFSWMEYIMPTNPAIDRLVPVRNTPQGIKNY